MALIKCKDCGKEISSSASKCPHCGVKRPGFSETLAAVLVFGFIVCIGAAAWMGSRDDAKKDEAPAPAASIAQILDEPADAPLSPRETGKIFSEYVSQLQAKLYAMGSISEIYTARMRQDAAYGKLDDMRADSEALKVALMKDAEEIGEVQFGAMFEDADLDCFERAQEIAQTMAADDVEMAVDIAVQANYGLDDGGTDMNKLARDLREQRRAFNTAVMAAYKHFGYKSGDVNKATLTLNASDTPHPSPAPAAPLANFSESFRDPPAATH
jgi:hypothetical protein